MWIRHDNQGKIHKLIDYFCLIVQNSLCNAKCANSSEIECSFRFRKKIVMKTKWNTQKRHVNCDYSREANEIESEQKWAEQLAFERKSRRAETVEMSRSRWFAVKFVEKQNVCMERWMEGREHRGHAKGKDTQRKDSQRSHKALTMLPYSYKTQANKSRIR